MTTRTITGTIYHADGTAWVGATVAFAMERGTFTVGPDVTFLQDGATAVTGALGTFSVTLTSGLDVYWRVALPDGDGFRFALPAGSATTLEALRSASEGLPVPITTGADILITSATEGQIFVHDGTQFVNTSRPELATTETTPVLSTTAGFSSLIDTGGADPTSVAGLFVHPMRVGHVISKRFTSPSGVGATGDSYEAAMLVHLESAHAEPDAVALVMSAAAEVAGASAYGSNIIVRSELAGTNPKLIGMEIDILPGAGTGDCAAGSSGLYLLLFGNERLGPAIVVTGAAGGLWDYGLLINNIRTDGAGVVVQADAPEMEWGIHLNNGTYGTAAAQFGGQNDIPALILNRGVDGATTNVFSVQNHLGTENWFSVSGIGQARIETTAPQLIFYETDAGTNAKYWDVLVLGEVMNFRVLNDAVGAAAGWLTVTRSGAVPFGIVFNEEGADCNFRVESDTDANALTVDGATGYVGVGVAVDGTFGAKLDVAGAIAITDGMTAPSAATAKALIYVDEADGDLKVKFADGVTKVLAADT
jgi:hypothetical protein